MEEKPVTLSALNRVEKKIEQFKDEQQAINNKVFDTVSRLETTLNSLDLTLKINHERESLFAKTIDKHETITEKLTNRIVDLERCDLEGKATMNTIKFILFSCIPLIGTILGLIMYFK
jgi:hypothetical protein